MVSKYSEPWTLKGFPLAVYIAGWTSLLVAAGVGAEIRYNRIREEQKERENKAQVTVVQSASTNEQTANSEGTLVNIVTGNPVENSNSNNKSIEEKVAENIDYKTDETKPVQPEISETPKPKYSAQDLEETRRILYAEAANQPRTNRRLIGRVILNRVASKRYPDTIHNVIYQPNAFSCIDDSSNPNWKQATGKKKRNEYEEKIFQRCLEDAKAVLDGKKEGINRENEIIAYHDTSLDIKDLRKKDPFWKSVEEVYRNERLIFYAYKSNHSSRN